MSKPMTNTLRSRIAGLILQGTTLTEIAGRAGFDRSKLTKWMNHSGKYDITMGTADRLSIACEELEKEGTQNE